MFPISIKFKVSLLLAATIFITYLVLQIGTNQRGTAYPLLAPKIDEVNAQGSTIGNILDNEAGLAAYFQSPNGIQLQSIKPVFRTIEIENDNFIIGSVPVKDYSDPAEDVHVFVSSDGWLVVYYLASDPASKIVDVRALDNNQSVIVTKLETVLQMVSATAGVGYEQPSFYDFRHPNATRLMVVAGKEDFSIELPSGFSYFERGLSTGTDRSAGVNSRRCAPRINNDGSGITSQITGNGYYFSVDASRLLSDTSHTITSQCPIALLLIYSEG